MSSIMRNIISVLLEGSLEKELDEELGYSNYNYQNKETGSNQNMHSNTIMYTNYGDMNITPQSSIMVTMNSTD